jgi:hypothetical protein
MSCVCARVAGRRTLRGSVQCAAVYTAKSEGRTFRLRSRPSYEGPGSYRTPASTPRCWD